MYYWRTISGVEVDFVLYGMQGIHAIEVKNSDRIRPEDLQGLTTFKGDYPGSDAFLLYRGEEKLLINGINCLPVEMFLSRLDPAG